MRPEQSAADRGAASGGNAAPQDPGREAGFTLLEIVVALIIASLALGVLVRGGIEGLRAVRLAQRYDQAVSRARSHLATVGRGVAVRSLHQEGDDGGGFTWQITIRPVGVATLGGGAADALHPMRETLFEVEASESWQGPAGARGVTLRTRRTAVTPAGAS